jgi:hypothetical protein
MDRDKIIQALAFARSVIKSGEPWTDECEKIIGGAISALSQSAVSEERVAEVIQTAPMQNIMQDFDKVIQDLAHALMDAFTITEKEKSGGEAQTVKDIIAQMMSKQGGGNG